MYVRRKVFSRIETEGEVKLFSVNETVLEQREFNARKHNQRQRIAKAEQQAQAQANKAAKKQAQLEAEAKVVNEKFGGDAQKYVDSLADHKSKGKYQSEKNMQELKNVVSGQEAAAQGSVKKAQRSAEVASEAMADQVHNYGKTRKSVHQEGGNTFKVAGKEVNVVEGAAGDALVNTKSGAKNGNVATQTLSKSSERRMKDLEAQANRGFNVSGPTKSQSKRALRSNAKNTHVVTGQAPVNIIRPESAPANSINVASTAKTVSKEVKAPKTLNAAERVMRDAKKWVKKNPKTAAGAAIGATALTGATIVGTRVYKKNKENKE